MFKTKSKVEISAPVANKSSIIDLVDELVDAAHAMHVSDIHLNPTENVLKIRFRIDGVLKTVREFPIKIHPEIISRIKVLSQLRTDEHQAPQDGRFRKQIGSGFVDVRVSIVPSYYGENIVLRLLIDKADQFTLASLGFSKDNAEKIIKAINKPFGMILATGPTGSGKTTTLYTLIKMLNRDEVSIVTIEDPIEYAIPGIEQIQVNQRVGLNFATGLRYILRQDPNIIMVGEIRDPQTASIAVNTALTGHLLLSTLHTNDSATTLPRLLEMGIQSYLVASTVSIAIAQRLVRKICTDCRTTRELTEIEFESLNANLPDSASLKTTSLYVGRGCATCADTGYHGRIGIHEVLVADNEIREALLRRASVEEIKQIAIKNGMTTMLQDGLIKAEQGLTTIEEVLSAIHE